MNIPQPVINTFKRVGIDTEFANKMANAPYTEEVANRFSGETCKTNPLIAYLIEWVYRTSNKYEMGNHDINISDFDRIRHFIAKVDSDAYMTCID